MGMRRWSGSADWEEIRPLGAGGQSQVVLVRNQVRITERDKYLNTLMRLAGQGFDEARAQQHVEATLGYGRPEMVAEVGALKLYGSRGDGPAADRQAAGRLGVEIKVLAQRISGLPRLLDYKESDRWIVTEFCPGGTLEQNVLRYRGDPVNSLLVFRTIVETVAGLHKQSIFHRDIKPANVFYRADGSLVLGDLGIAFLPDLPERLTFLNESVGPRDYMPPWAQAEDRLEEVGGQFDVYMLGKLLWCMVAGRLKLVREWYVRPEFDLRLKFPDDPRMHMINAILEKCLHDAPEACLPNAGELLVVVDEHLQVMKRGGQMLREGVPRPCRVCGKGFYEVPRGASGASGPIFAFPSGSSKVPGYHAGTWIQEGAFYAQPFVCSSCGNVQLFKAQ